MFLPTRARSLGTEGSKCQVRPKLGVQGPRISTLCFHTSLVTLVMVGALASSFEHQHCIIFLLKSMNLGTIYLFQIHSFAKTAVMCWWGETSYIQGYENRKCVLLVLKITATVIQFKRKLFSIHDNPPPKMITVLK